MLADLICRFNFKTSLLIFNTLFKAKSYATILLLNSTTHQIQLNSFHIKNQNRKTNHPHSPQEKTEEIASKQEAVDSTVESGLELMKHISGDEALQLKDKLDALQRRYNDLTSRGAELLRVASETLPLVQQLYNSHAR